MADDFMTETIREKFTWSDLASVLAIAFHEAPTGTVTDDSIEGACYCAAGFLFTDYDIAGDNLKRFVAEVRRQMSDLSDLSNK